MSNAQYSDPLFVVHQPYRETMDPNPHELLPRKRKFRDTRPTAVAAAEAAKIPLSAMHLPRLDPMLENEQPFSWDQLSFNQYMMYNQMMRKVDSKMTALKPVRTKAPMGLKKWLLQEKTYALADNTPAEPPYCIYPVDCHERYYEMFKKHNRERYKMSLSHRVQREHLITTYETEILREYGRAVGFHFLFDLLSIHGCHFINSLDGFITLSLSILLNKYRLV